MFARAIGLSGAWWSWPQGRDGVGGSFPFLVALGQAGFASNKHVPHCVGKEHKLNLLLTAEVGFFGVGRTS